ncbi:DUF2935 domain-containing protein [Effusibacillus consociatus]|uniref:DUF2935 domain-containing protein n=1 Tax=Effusibacillus consociatus TaxID=1117041 RepID=A0ABV9Q0Q6_9BACL
MFFAYGHYMDLRVLDEIDFWKQQESEHTVVIQQLAPNLEPQFAEQLKAWGVAFAGMQGMSQRYTESLVRGGGIATPLMHTEIVNLTRMALEQSLQFIEFLNQLQTMSAPIKANPVINVVINHIRRESEYFIGAVQVLVYPRSHVPLVP